VSVVLLRHAWAGDKTEWIGDDALRPLDERGRLQALALRDLAARGVNRVISSPHRRCVETVEPLAELLQVTLELDDRLVEGAPPELALELLAELDGSVVCTHGDIIEAVIGRHLKKGAAVVVAVDGDEVKVLEKLRAP
jgi:8-oxo-dGTP diphosphatase